MKISFFHLKEQNVWSFVKLMAFEIITIKHFNVAIWKIYKLQTLYFVYCLKATYKMYTPNLNSISLPFPML